MSKRDLPTEEASKLPRILYTPSEVSAMTGIEYQGVLAAIKAGEIPAEKIGNRYFVLAWWVNRLLNGTDERGADDEVAQRRAS